jgi:tetraacyldisaccharide 4'-kinase
MSRFLKDIAMGRSRGLPGELAKPVLMILSFIYGGAVVLCAWLYRRGILFSYRAGRPVISVGNITAGGAGKTPLVIFLARVLQRRGLHPVILTRGYMPDGSASDEARMVAEVLTDVEIAVDPDRIAAVRRTQHKADVFILDDGFQHWRLRRDLNIVVIDATRPFGNGHLLPRGTLREPLFALKRARIVVLTRTDLGAGNVEDIRCRLKRYCPKALVVETVHAPVAVRDLVTGVHASLEGIKGQVAVVSAIGAPQAFEDMLVREGVRVGRRSVFDDHHVYSIDDIRQIVAACREQGISKVLTTHKDAVKIGEFRESFQGVDFLVVEIEIKVVHGQIEFFSRLDRLFRP